MPLDMVSPTSAMFAVKPAYKPSNPAKFSDEAFAFKAPPADIPRRTDWTAKYGAK